MFKGFSCCNIISILSIPSSNLLPPAAVVVEQGYLLAAVCLFMGVVTTAPSAPWALMFSTSVMSNSSSWPFMGEDATAWAGC